MGLADNLIEEENWSNWHSAKLLCLGNYESDVDGNELPVIVKCSRQDSTPKSLLYIYIYIYIYKFSPSLSAMAFPNLIELGSEFL